MSRLANANKRPKVIAALRRAGFHIVHGGKHAIVTDANGEFVSTLPNARELNPTTLRAILKQCGLSVAAFLELY
jgi:predicted RNA binding protein YcfA (HicA-like mRNA interferase family)